MKNIFPFRLGTTSYVLNDELLINLHFLKDKIDHIELLVFESGTENNYPPPALIKELTTLASDYNLTYSVHLPLDVKLGNPVEHQRQADVSKVLRAIDATYSINPNVWDLHLEQNYQGQIIGQHWQEACIRSLEELKERGVDPSRIGIENLEFDYNPILPILEETGFSATLDIGHVWFNNLEEAFYLTEVLPHAISFHVHGHNGHQDHKGLHTIEVARLYRFLHALKVLPGTEMLPVSMEVFSRECFEQSLKVMETAYLELYNIAMR